MPCALTAAPPRRRVSRHPPGSDGHRRATDGPQRLRRPAGYPGIRPASDGPGGPTVRPGRRQRLRRPAGALASGQLQAAQEGPRCAPWQPAAAKPRPGQKVLVDCCKTAGPHSCKIFSPYRACKAKTDRICSRPLRYTGAKAGPWHPAAPPPPCRCPGRLQLLPCLLCPNWTRAQLYKLVSVDLPAVFVGS